MSYLRKLKEQGIEIQETPFSSASLTCRAVADELGIPLSHIAKTMVTLLPSRSIVLAVLCGASQLDLKKMRGFLSVGRKELRLASTEDIQHLGLVVGAVSPLIKMEMSSARVIVDRELAEIERVNISSGDPTTGLTIKMRDLIQITEADIADVRRSDSD